MSYGNAYRSSYAGHGAYESTPTRGSTLDATQRPLLSTAFAALLRSNHHPMASRAITPATAPAHIGDNCLGTGLKGTKVDNQIARIPNGDCIALPYFDANAIGDA